VLLWPLLVATEFRPWVLFEPDNLKVTAQFLGQLLAAGARREFLAMVARETWRTVAIATAGMTLALVLAMPLTLLSTRACCRSRRCRAAWHAVPALVRQAVRWLLIVLRSVPELVWALVFVRVVGLGPTAGVLAIALTYGGMLGKVYGEILESARPTPRRRCCATAAAACRPSSTACCRRTRPS
jgi:phosphonate transport system permease protein